MRQFDSAFETYSLYLRPFEIGFENLRSGNTLSRLRQNLLILEILLTDILKCFVEYFF